MGSHWRMISIIALGLCLLPPCTENASGQIVIDDAPIAPEQTLDKATLFAYRKIPDDAIAAADPSGNRWVLQKTAILGSARTDPSVFKLYSQSPPSGYSANENLEAAIRAYKEATALRRPADKPAAGAEPILVKYKPSPLHEVRTIDAVAIREMFASGAAADATQTADWAVFKGDSGVSLDPQFAKTTKSIYATLDLTNKAAWSAQSVSDIANVTKIAQSNNRVASATLVRLGDITIGKVLVYPASDKKLVLERSISKAYDVYWMEFAFSPGEETVAQVSELFFLVTLQLPSAIALELVPLRYGTETNVTQKTNSPEVGIESGGNKITVGQFYEQTVEYKQLKPTVLATGLHEARFGWRLKDDIIDASSKRLIAIVGVPKNTHEVSLSMAVSATIKHWWNYYQSQKGATEPKSQILKLGG